jgi:hypothetical protein
MKDFYADVPLLGDVVIANHAKDRIIEQRIPDWLFEEVLLKPTAPDVPDGFNIRLRERNGIRLVLLFTRRLYLLKTAFRVHTLVATLGCPRGRSHLLNRRR